MLPVATKTLRPATGRLLCLSRKWTLARSEGVVHNPAAAERARSADNGCSKLL
jgi:hypothetical protein